MVPRARVTTEAGGKDEEEEETDAPPEPAALPVPDLTPPDLTISAPDF